MIETEYVGRVIDVNTQQAVTGAKVTLDLEGVPPIIYTDSEGVYRFKVAIDSNISGQIRVDAEGYHIYTRNIEISPALKTIEDIRLTPLIEKVPITEFPSVEVAITPEVVSTSAQVKWFLYPLVNL